MSVFDDVLSADAEFFVDADIIGGEEVVYEPRDKSAPRRMNAIVDRNPKVAPAGVPGEPRAITSVIIIVRNHPSAGVLATEIDEGDRFRFARHKGGGDMVSRPVIQATADAGMVRVRIS